MTGGAYFYVDMAWFLDRWTLVAFDSDIECIVSLLLIMNMARYIHVHVI
jgi:hypothetical protein